MSKKNGLADPTRLKPYDADDKQLLRVVIEGEQGNKQGKECDDRIIAVEQDAHSWEDIKTITDLSKQFCRELKEFFVNYHRLTGKEYRVLGLKGPNQARKLVKSGRR